MVEREKSQTFLFNGQTCRIPRLKLGDPRHKNESVSMDTIIRSGLNGLIAASSRLQVAANSIALSGSRDDSFSQLSDPARSANAKAAYTPKKPENEGQSSGGIETLSGNNQQDLNQYQDISHANSHSPSLAEGIVQMKVAARTYEANAKVIQMAQEMYDEENALFGHKKR